MKRALKWIAGGVAALVVIALLIVYFNLNSIVRSSVQRASATSLKTPTRLDSAHVGLFTGNVSLSGFDIETAPAWKEKGFRAPKLFELGSVDVDTSYGDLMKDVVGIDSILIDRPVLTIEFSGLTSSLKLLVDNLDLSSEGETKKVKIKKLSVNGCKVVLRPNFEGLRESYSLTLPTVSLDNIGTSADAQNGEEIGRVIKALISKLAAEAVESKDLPPELANLKQILAGDAQGLINAVGGKLQSEVNTQIDATKNKIDAELGKLQNRLPAAATQNLNLDTTKLGDEAKKQLDKGLGDLLKRGPSTKPAR